MRKDDVTSELPGVARRPGRPPTGNAMTPAQKKAAQRARLKAEGIEQVNLNLPKDVADALRGYVERKNADTAAELVTLGDAATAILRGYLLRKR